MLKIQEQNKLNSIRGKKCLNDDSESFLPVSKREEKKKDLDESKRVIFCLATAAAAVNGGVFLKSGHKRNIEGVEQKMNEAENSLLW